MKVVMYHYVREYQNSHPHFRFLDINNFRKQLDFFEAQFGFVEKEEWLEFTQTGTMPKKNSKVVLTFDDSLCCHYHYVFPELVKRKQWGIFYVPTLPYCNGKILDVHRIHLLSGAFDGKKLLEVSLQLIHSDMIPGTKNEEFKNESYRWQNNYNQGVEFKRLLNYFVDYKNREAVIDAIAEKLDYQFTSNDYYASIDQLQEMKRSGMIIGSHGNSHRLMSKLNFDEQVREIELSFAILDQFDLIDVKNYCHPYGRPFSYNQNTVRILNQFNVVYSFDLNYRDIVASDFVSSMQTLPRYDCNFFEHGKVS